MGKQVRRSSGFYTFLIWLGAAVCLASVGLIFGVSGSVGIPICAVGVAIVAIALAGQRSLGPGGHASL